MSKEIKTIGILTGGGDAPGLNAVIRAVVKTLISRYQIRVIGIEDGFQGLIDPVKMRELTTDSVRGLLPRGGTILGTRNKGDFVLKHEGDQVIRPEGVFEKAIENLQKNGIDALVILGGDGTQTIALEFHKMGFPIVGVPKTIDNDLECTDLTFGFDTAVEIATGALDRLHTTAESHDRVMVLEVMGRNAGWIALSAGLAGGADCIVIPEIPFYMEKIAQKVKEREQEGKLFSIIVAAEGASEFGQEQLHNATTGQLGGIAQRIAEKIGQLTGKDTRFVVLGHIQRGGQPTTTDRLLATSLGVAAAHEVAKGSSGVMVGFRGSKIELIKIEDAVSKIKTVREDNYLVQYARDLGISFAGEND